MPIWRKQGYEGASILQASPSPQVGEEEKTQACKMAILSL